MSGVNKIPSVSESCRRIFGIAQQHSVDIDNGYSLGDSYVPVNHNIAKSELNTAWKRRSILYVSCSSKSIDEESTSTQAVINNPIKTY